MIPPGATEPPADPARLVLGTRGSALALAQAHWVMAALRAARPGLEIEVRIIRTSGDVNAAAPLTSGDEVGQFVRQIEEELLDGKIDFAVHSLKDLPLAQPDGLVIAAIPPREDPHDVLITRQSSRLGELPPGSRIGTGSPRRIAQLRTARGDLRFVPIRGNVDTRLRKLERGEVDALVLAAAGLNRMGASPGFVEVLPFDVMLPAPGQGALALEARVGESSLARLLQSALHHASTAATVGAERRLLRTLGGGCQMPVGALGETRGERLILQGVVGDPLAGRIVRGSLEGSSESPERLGEELGRQLLDSGAAEILAGAGSPGAS